MVWTGLVCLMGMRALTILVPFRSKSFVFAAMREETIPWSNNGDSQNDRYLLEGLGSTNMDERMQDPHNHAVLNGSLAEQKPLPEKTSKTEKWWCGRGPACSVNHVVFLQWSGMLTKCLIFCLYCLRMHLYACKHSNLHPLLLSLFTNQTEKLVFWFLFICFSTSTAWYITMWIFSDIWYAGSSLCETETDLMASCIPYIFIRAGK